MKGKIRLLLCLSLLALMLLVISSVPLVESTVGRGTVSVQFPNDFPTARSYQLAGFPYYFTLDYLLEGEGQVNARFYSSAGNGSVTVNASSEAFLADSMLTQEVIEYQKHIFPLTFNIKSGIDGTYRVSFKATNELGTVLFTASVDLEVWSIEHKEGAEAVYTAQMLIGYSPALGGGLLGPTYESPEAQSNRTLAVTELALANLAHNAKEWNNAKTHAQNATEWIRKADSAEKEFFKLKEESTNIANDANLKTTYLLELITYPTLIITILIMVYIIVAIFRKIRPLPK